MMRLVPVAVVGLSLLSSVSGMDAEAADAVKNRDRSEREYYEDEIANVQRAYETNPENFKVTTHGMIYSKSTMVPQDVIDLFDTVYMPCAEGCRAAEKILNKQSSPFVKLGGKFVVDVAKEQGNVGFLRNLFFYAIGQVLEKKDDPEKPQRKGYYVELADDIADKIFVRWNSWKNPEQKDAYDLLGSSESRYNLYAQTLCQKLKARYAEQEAELLELEVRKAEKRRAALQKAEAERRKAARAAEKKINFQISKGTSSNGNKKTLTKQKNTFPRGAPQKCSVALKAAAGAKAYGRMDVKGSPKSDTASEVSCGPDGQKDDFVHNRYKEELRAAGRLPPK